MALFRHWYILCPFLVVPRKEVSGTAPGRPEEILNIGDLIMVPVRRNSASWLPEIFNDFFDNSWMERANSTAPAINVKENEKEYDVELAAPGLTKDDFKVSLDPDGNLVITMEKKHETKEEKKHERFLRREFSYEKFQQMLALPENADAEHISAKVENGVLNINIPKLTQDEIARNTRLIDIQ